MPSIERLTMAPRPRHVIAARAAKCDPVSS
jgi:hypothetical protein